MCYSLEILVCKFIYFTLIPPCIGTHFSQFHLPVENAAQFSAAVAIHTVPLFVLPGTHHCWVDSVGVESKLLHIHWTLARGEREIHAGAIAGPTLVLVTRYP